MQPGVFELIVCARLGISENSAETRFQRAPFHVEHRFLRTTFLARSVVTYSGQQGDYAAPHQAFPGSLPLRFCPPHFIGPQPSEIRPCGPRRVYLSLRASASPGALKIDLWAPGRLG